MEILSGVFTSKKKGKLEKVQRRATKMVQAIKHYPHPDRLKYFDLPTLVYRRRRADLLQVFRYFSGLDHFKGENIFILDRSKITRGHSLRLMKQWAKNIYLHYLVDRGTKILFCT